MNYEKLLNMPYKRFVIFIVIILISLVVFISVLNVEVYDVYNTYAIAKDNNLILNIPITYSDTILNAEYYKIGDNRYKYEVLYISEILLDTSSLMNYQEVIIVSEDEIIDNMVINISIYYNHEKVLEKLKKLLW